MPPVSSLIEIGTEELPVAALELYDSLAEENIRKILTKNRLDFKSVRIDATPRRLAFFIESLAPKQKDEKSMILGPAYDRAYDADKKPTPALEGFLKAQGASPRAVRVHETPRGRYAALEKTQKGEVTVKVLPRLIPEILNSFPFPKMMRWEKTGFRFPRPIRWAVGLYGNKVLPLTFAGIKVGRTSRGHRFLSPKSFPIPRADWKDYARRLRSHHVILSLKDREALVSKVLKRFHQREADPELIREASQLVEEPFPMQGKFSGTYRDLPEEVLETCMKKYQKIFACRDPQGNLINRFVAILNGRRSHLGRIQHDYENVLESRLRDAQYFHDEDTKEPLTHKVERLKELVFLGRLGTMQERVERLRKLVKEFTRLSGRPELEQTLDRAALLSKADLVTHMVGEFPELQGIMGREYAQAGGETLEVARAIGEQYLPKNLSEDYRKVEKKLSLAGAIFGIADRVDLLAGAFGIQLEPTGSEDPYALRRAAGVLTKLIRAFSLRFSLSELIQKSHSFYQGKLNLSASEVLSKLLGFLKERMAFELQVKPGSRAYEILQGVLKSSFDDFADVFERFETLLEISSKEPKIFFKTSKVVERTSNILKGVQDKLNSVDPKLFREPLEKEIYGLLEKNKAELRSFVDNKDYRRATRFYGETFFDPLHLFFEKVMVNVEDASVRRNRQALMKEINTLYTQKVADLSLLTQVREMHS